MIYGTLVEATTYHSDRGNSAWAAATDPDKNTALQRATEFIDTTYLSLWPGYKTGGRAQELEWPRTDAWVEDGATISAIGDAVIPNEVINATYEAALRELASPGALTPDVTPGELVRSASVDGAVSVEYWDKSTKPVIEKINLVLSPLFAVVGQRNSLSGKVNIA